MIAAYLALGLSVALATPPWEANDEVDHVRNVETLAEGRAYRIPSTAIGEGSGDAGLEPHQAPLYYLILAGWQTLVGEPATDPEPRARSVVAGIVAPRRGEPLYAHEGPQEEADRRLVRTLRLPGLAFGCGLILLAWATARRLSADAWTPVVAAAVAASVPKFIFLSAVVNNDNLVALLGGALTFAAVLLLTGGATRRARAGLSTALGILLGALILTKITGFFLAVPVVLAAVWAARDRREGIENVALAAGAAVLVSGWWLIRNAIWYGDPLASRATRDYLGILVEPVYGAFEQAFVRLPQGVWESAWYNSGWNQFDWSWPLYAPFWALAAVGAAGYGAAVVRRRAGKGEWLLGAFALSAVATVWAIGLTTPQTQARVGFGGLAAIACLLALGFERLGIPVPARFALPLLGFAGTAAALVDDVINVY